MSDLAWQGALSPRLNDGDSLRALAQVAARFADAARVVIHVRDRWATWTATWPESGIGSLRVGTRRQIRAVGAKIYVQWPLGSRVDEVTWQTVSAFLRVALAGWRRAREQAGWDVLTQLPNRRTMEELLRRTWEAIQRYGGSLAVLLVDVDDLKHWNDTYGHEAGDRALVRVARALRNECRAADIVGRWGGDEFLVLLPRTDAAGAARLSQRLIACVRRPGLSVGLADSSEVARKGPGALIRLADKRLRAAKHGRGGRGGR